MKKATRLKTLEDVTFQNRVPYLHQRIKTVQDTIPLETVFPDGIFHLSNGNYSAVWRFTDVNYGVAAKDEKRNIFFGWGDLLSGLPEGVSSKVTIFNRRRDRNLSEALFIQGGGQYADEYNRYVKGLLESGNGIIQDKYITVNAANKKDVREARSFFAQVGSTLSASFARVGSTAVRMDLNDRLRIFHDFYRFGTEDRFRLPPEGAGKGSVKDLIAPMSLCNNRDYMEMGNLFLRSLMLTDYGGFVSDDLIAELCRLDHPMMLSIDVIPIPLQEAVGEAQRRYDATEAAVAEYRRKHPELAVSYVLDSERKKAKEVLDDLLDRGQGLSAITVTLAHLAASKEELDADTETLKTVCAQRHCRLDTLTHQQIDGLNTVLPYGQIFVPFNYLMTTDPASALMPFSAQEICDHTGIPYGQQAVSGNILVADRRLQVNGSGFNLGVPGSGKSLLGKKEIYYIHEKEKEKADILVIDPNGEYCREAEALGGAVIDLASGGDTYINAMDLDASYDDKNPIALKSEFLLSLVDQMMGEEELNAKARSMLDRCVGLVYKDYVKGGYQGKAPTLRDLSQILKDKGGPVGQEIAQSIELYTTGTLDVFARETNVDVQNSFIVYNTKDLGANLQQVAMFVVLDQIWSRLTRNFLLGRATYIYIDEFYLMLRRHSTAEFFYKLWKQIRKYNGIPTGLTQNVDECLANPVARTMISNSDFLLMMRQAPSDAKRLAELFHISDEQLSYLRSAEPGCGLMKIGSALVPFQDSFPKDTSLYRLLSTNPREGRWDQKT